jgi:hypothetical protein
MATRSSQTSERLKKNANIYRLSQMQRPLHNTYPQYWRNM